MSERCSTAAIIETLDARSDVLEELLTDPMTKRTLEERLDVSRSTIDRAIRDLQSVELVEYTDGVYRITTFGELLVQEHQTFRRRARLLDEFRPFLRHVPPSTLDFDLSHLTDADLYTSESGDPYAMINRHVRALEHMDVERVLLPLTGLHAHETAHDAIVNGEARGEAIVTPHVIDTWQSNPQYATLTEELLATGRFDIAIYEGDIPCLICVFDEETVQLGAVKDGEPRALIETDADEILAWAERTLDEYRQQATELA